MWNWHSTFLSHQMLVIDPIQEHMKTRQQLCGGVFIKRTSCLNGCYLIRELIVLYYVLALGTRLTCEV